MVRRRGLEVAAFVAQVAAVQRAAPHAPPAVQRRLVQQLRNWAGVLHDAGGVVAAGGQGAARQAGAVAGLRREGSSAHSVQHYTLLPTSLPRLTRGC